MPVHIQPESNLDFPDDSFLVWRFLDLPKFLSLLHRRELWFSCPSRFQDPWDGHYPSAWSDPGNIREWVKRELEPIPDTDMKDAEARIHELVNLAVKTEKGIEGLSAFVRDRYGVSCWHISQYEPDAFWTLYSDRHSGIAIKSSVGRLKLAFSNTDRSITMGRVVYAREDEPNFHGGMLKQFFWKRPNFSYENELRLVVPLTSPQSMREFLERPDLDHERRAGGAGIGVNVPDLIKSVVISPLAPKWFEESVKELALRFDKNLQFEESALRSSPQV